jgi:hypothetical protein
MFAGEQGVRPNGRKNSNINRRSEIENEQTE